MKTWRVRWILPSDPTVPAFEMDVEAADSAAAHAVSLQLLMEERSEWRDWRFVSSILVRDEDDGKYTVTA